MRGWKVYSLNYNGEPNAVLIVDQSDLGLNLLELLNGIKILVTNTKGLPWDILSIAIGQLAPLYNKYGQGPFFDLPLRLCACNGYSL
jgi:hypothetical protein